MDVRGDPSSVVGVSSSNEVAEDEVAVEDEVASSSSSLMGCFTAAFFKYGANMAP